MRKCVASLILLGIACVISAQNDKSGAALFDTISSKKVQIVALPLVFYTPETNFGFGVGGQIYLLNQSNIYNARLSNIFVSAVYTLNKQFFFEVKPQLYFGKGDYFLDMAFKYKIFPNSFWGIGNSTPEENLEKYSTTSTELSVSFLKRLPPALNFGLEYIFEKYDMTEVQEGGILETGEVLGSDGAIVSGPGFVFNLDNRDDISSPFSGSYMQMKARVSSENMGATSNFNQYIFDLRTYRPLGGKSVLAIQVYIESNFGDVPFQAMAWFGGGERGRGYFNGRYIDNHQYVVQAEYRLRFHKRWILAGFVLFGEVADLPSNFFDNIHTSVGGGIRFQIIKSQSTLVRLDMGFGQDGNSGIYFGVNEAF